MFRNSWNVHQRKTIDSIKCDVMTSKTCVICNVKENGTFLCLIFDIELLFLTKFELTLLTFVISHHVSKCIIPKKNNIATTHYDYSIWKQQLWSAIFYWQWTWRKILIARHAEDPPLYSCYDVCVPLSVCICVNSIVNTY